MGGNPTKGVFVMKSSYNGPRYSWPEWKERYPWAIPAPSFDHAGRVVFGHLGSPTFPTEPCYCEEPEPKRPRSKGYTRGVQS